MRWRSDPGDALDLPMKWDRDIALNHAQNDGNGKSEICL